MAQLEGVSPCGDRLRDCLSPSGDTAHASSVIPLTSMSQTETLATTRPSSNLRSMTRRTTTDSNRSLSVQKGLVPPPGSTSPRQEYSAWRTDPPAPGRAGSGTPPPDTFEAGGSSPGAPEPQDLSLQILALLASHPLDIAKLSLLWVRELQQSSDPAATATRVREQRALLEWGGHRPASPKDERTAEQSWRDLLDDDGTPVAVQSDAGLPPVLTVEESQIPAPTPKARMGRPPKFSHQPRPVEWFMREVVASDGDWREASTVVGLPTSTTENWVQHIRAGEPPLRESCDMDLLAEARSALLRRTVA